MRMEGLFPLPVRGLGKKAVDAGLRRLAERVQAEGGLPLAVERPDGERIAFGSPVRTVVRLREGMPSALLASPSLGGIAQAYVEGQLEFEGDLLDAVEHLARLSEAAGNLLRQGRPPPRNRHTRALDHAAIASHYDVGNDFYRLWLDRRMVYSCAYFERGDEDLDTAQAAKLEHVCRKLRLLPGERLLDVGCGWGGLLIHAAQHHGVRAVGITLSAAQLQEARERVGRAGLADRVEVLQLDYRDLPRRFGAESFDKVASIGMFEHVGLAALPEYFGALARVLRERGLLMNHGITATSPDEREMGAGAGEFIDRYVFPHGELPHLHRAVREMSAQGFEVADVESLRPHYAITLAHWLRRLEARFEEAAITVDAKKLRIWRAYLAGCSHAFRAGWMNIHQVLASRQGREGPTELPLTRRDLYRAA